MQNFEPAMFVAVLHEMLGPLLWVIVAGSVVATLACLWLLIRDRGLVSRRFLGSEFVGIAGGFAAVVVMQVVTQSRLTDVGGPVDWLLIALIWLIGAGGTTVLVYDLRGLWAGRPKAVHDET
jgi:O-antigen/teichoic acid export membrane protein